jgi:hypothetical protein
MAVLGTTKNSEKYRKLLSFVHIIPFCIFFFVHHDRSCSARALLLQLMYIRVSICLSACLYVTEVDHVHSVCHIVIKFGTEMAPHTRNMA